MQFRAWFIENSLSTTFTKMTLYTILHLDTEFIFNKK